MTTMTNEPPVLLVAGHWLGAWAWDEVVEHLGAAGRRTLPMTLPGLDAADPERASKTLDDQVAAIEAAMEQAAGPQGETVVLVAHSGANGPVTRVLDRHPEKVRRVVWVDSGPVGPGSVFAPDLPDSVVELPLPPFEALGQFASLEGLSGEVLDRFRARAVPEPGPVVRQAVELTDEARQQVPTTLVCCSMRGAQVMELAAAGHPMFAEVAKLEHVDVVDLPTGHWPMWSRPADLARVLLDCLGTEQG
ncbi:alpha/beta fold hydrolase [Cellulomonas soli]